MIKKLQLQQNAGIIQRVEFANWAAPIVPVIGENLWELYDHCEQSRKARSLPHPQNWGSLRFFVWGKLFSKLDLAHAYEQIPLDEVSKQFVINTYKGYFSATGCCLELHPLQQFSKRRRRASSRALIMSMYIDNILVTGQTEAEHLQHLAEVLTYLEKAGIHLKD